MKYKIFFLLSILVSTISNAQVSEETDLYQEILKMDQLIFEDGFNNCKFDSLEGIMHNDMVFYHDKGGISYEEDFMKSMKQNICSSPNRKPIRKLTDQGFKVFPLYNNGVLYGAIQEGIHEFFIKEPNKELYKTNIARFNHTWVLENKEWKLKVILSYDHLEP
ncbi:MAG: nuclear transport factor 2 family protein [Flavobacteriaceae bacterium]|nr:nuclear transport factor 2 family protein [Flavobacteriaceae bacterium]